MTPDQTPTPQRPAVEQVGERGAEDVSGWTVVNLETAVGHSQDWHDDIGEIEAHEVASMLNGAWTDGRNVTGTAHTRGAEEMRERAAQWHEAEAETLDQAREVQETKQGGMFAGGYVATQQRQFAEFHRRDAAAIRALPIQPAPGGEGSC